MQFTIFAGENGKPSTECPRGERHSASWERLVERIRAPGEYAEKGACPLLKLATFDGDYRSNERLEQITGVEGDYDGETVSIVEAAMALCEHNITAVLYTSPSHAPERPRWRVLCPLSRPHAPNERLRFVARLNAALGGVLSSESFVPAQAFYAGRITGREYAVQEVQGTPLDQIEGLAEVGPRINHTPVGADGKLPSETTDDELRETIRTGRDGVQRALLSLAARFAGRGMPAEDVAGTLRLLMDACEWRERDRARWQKRYDSIARAAETAAKKYGRSATVVAKAEPAVTPFGARTAREIMNAAARAAIWCVPDRVPCGLVIIGARPRPGSRGGRCNSTSRSPEAASSWARNSNRAACSASTSRTTMRE